MTKAIIAIIIILLIAGGIFYFTSGNEVSTTPTPSASSLMTTTPTMTPTATPISGTGKVLIEIVDTAADMGTVTEVQMTLSKVELHSQAKGWMTITTESNTFKLLSLKASGHIQFAGEASASAGIYDQVKLTIDKVIIKTKDGAQKTAKLPGKTFAVSTNMTVNGGQTSSAKIDILADKSLHMTTTGEYVFAPTAETETRSNVTASVDSHDVVTSSGGTVTSTTKAGMDLDGSIKADFMIDANANIKLTDGVLAI